MADPIRVTVWNEYRHERESETIAAVYPDGIHSAIAGHLNGMHGISARTATFDEPQHGLSEDVLRDTDVLTWWGHRIHNEVADEVVERVQQRVWEGMGLIALHSAHLSKIFRRLMGTGCWLKWREAGERERIWIVDPSHPIAAGLGESFEIPQAEMYGEHFDIPAPDEVVFISWFQGGEVFRSGCTFRRGNGKIFYFRPGHETFPIYHQAEVLRVIGNAVRWAAQSHGAHPTYGNALPVEELSWYDGPDLRGHPVEVRERGTV